MLADVHAQARRAGLVERAPDATQIATIAGLPLLLGAVAIGLGTDVAAWAAPWALFGAVGFALGLRAGRVGALACACLALVVGPVALIGTAAGAAAGELAAHGVRPFLALPVGLAAAFVTAATLGLAWG